MMWCSYWLPLGILGSQLVFLVLESGSGSISSQGRAEDEVSLILSVMLGSHVTTHDGHKKFNCGLRNFLLFHPQICICIPLTTGTNACKVILLGLLGWASHPVNSALF